MHQYDFELFNKQKGYHWFERGTMRFFNSRISNWDSIEGYFISSERGPDGFRRYTIRIADFDTGQVSTVGEFQEYKTLARAKAALNKIKAN